MICWWCVNTYLRGPDVKCKEDGHVLDDDFYLAKQPDKDCPINKEKGGVKYGDKTKHPNP